MSKEMQKNKQMYRSKNSKIYITKEEEKERERKKERKKGELKLTFFIDN